MKLRWGGGGWSRGDAQRQAFRVNKAQKTGALSARALGQNTLVSNVYKECTETSKEGKQNVQDKVGEAFN
jgi:hypothetical protein